MTEIMPKKRIYMAVLLLIIMLQGLEGLIRIDAPFTEPAAGGRSTVNAMFARNYYENGFNFFLPQLDYGTFPGYAVQEFPLIPYIVALSYKVTGVQEWVARLVPLLFGLGVTVMVYLIGKNRYQNTIAGIVGAFVVAISPILAYFSRTFQSDSAMVFFVTLAVYLLVRRDCSGRRGVFWGSGVCLALGFLLKPSSLVLIPVFVFLLMEADTQASLTRKVTVIAKFLCLAILPSLAFYAYAEYLNSFSNMGILAVARRASLEHVTTTRFYIQLAKDFLQAVTPIGLLAMVGFVYVMFRGKKIDWVLSLWVTGVLLLMIMFNEAIAHHEYYQMIWVPAAGMAAAKFANWILDHASTWKNRSQVILAAGSIAAVVLSIAIHWQFVELRLRFPDQAQSRLEAAKWIADHTPENVKLVAVSLPDILYYSRRRGWYVEAETGGTTDPKILNSICRDDCDYFVSVDGGRELSQKMVQYLEQGGQLHRDGLLVIWKIPKANGPSLRG